MLGVLGLLTGWLLLMPLLVSLWLRVGGAYHEWMLPFAHIASSVPMLGFCTVGGVAMMAWGVISLARGAEFER